MEKYIPKDWLENSSTFDKAGYRLTSLLRHLDVNADYKFIDNYDSFELVIRDVALGFKVEIKNYKDGLYCLVNGVSINLHKSEYSVAELISLKKKIDKLIFDVKKDVLIGLMDKLKEKVPVFAKTSTANSTFLDDHEIRRFPSTIQIKFNLGDVGYVWEVDKDFTTLVKLILPRVGYRMDDVLSTSMLHYIHYLDSTLYLLVKNYKQSLYLTQNGSTN